VENHFNAIVIYVFRPHDIALWGGKPSIDWWPVICFDWKEGMFEEFQTPDHPKPRQAMRIARRGLRCNDARWTWTRNGKAPDTRRGFSISSTASLK
jgi:hypothetical protein